MLLDMLEKFVRAVSEKHGYDYECVGVAVYSLVYVVVAFAVGRLGVFSLVSLVIPPTVTFISGVTGEWYDECVKGRGLDIEELNLSGKVAFVMFLFHILVLSVGR